jgi:hypothetical protein
MVVVPVILATVRGLNRRIIVHDKNARACSKNKSKKDWQ